MLEKTLESPVDCKEIKPVNPKGNQPWIFIRRTDGEAEAPVLWPPDAKSWLTGKDPDAGKDWRREEKGTTEDEMVGGITDSMDMSLSKLQEMVKDREAWSAAFNEVNKEMTESLMTEQLSNSNNVVVLFLVFRACYIEWSQSENEKHILYINAYIHGIYKDSTDGPYLQGSDEDTDMWTEDRLGDTLGKQSGINRDGSTAIYKLPYSKYIASGNLLFDTGSSNRVLCDNLEVW